MFLRSSSGITIERAVAGTPHQGKVLALVTPHLDDGPIFAFGTIAKLARVGMLAPVVMGLAILAARRPANSATSHHPRKKVAVPAFVIGFVVLVLFNSAVPLTPSINHGFAFVTDLGAQRLAEGYLPLVLGGTG